MNGSSQKFNFFREQTLSGIRSLRNFRLSYLRKVFSLMGKKEKIALLLLLALAVTGFLWSAWNFYSSQTTTVPDRGGKLAEAMLGQPTYLNPLLAFQEPDTSLVRLIFSGLYKYDAQGNLVPDMADGLPAISPDQKQYTVNLKQGVKWHNDKTFTADDVVFTVQILKDTAYKSPLRSLWQSTSVEKISDFTVKFTTKDVSGPFIHHLTLPMLPQNLWSRVEAQNFLLSKKNLEAVGTGPFSIKEITKLPSGKIQSLTLEAFADYYAGRPNLDDITVTFYDSEEEIINALHGKEITAYGFTPANSDLFLEKQQDDLQILSLPLPQYQVIFFNLHNPILTELPVRQALLLAADREKILSEILKDKARMPIAAPSAFASQNPGTNPPAADLQQAQAVLDAAGWTVDPATNLRAKKGKVLELTVVTNDTLANSEAAAELAKQWQRLNIKVNLSVQPTKQLTDTLIRPRTFEILLLSQKFGADPDPFLFWHSSQVRDPGLNLTGFSNADADQLITEARTTTDQALREKKYQEFEKIIAQQIPVIYLSQALYLYAVDNDLKNIGLKSLFEPGQLFTDSPNWYLKEKRVWK